MNVAQHTYGLQFGNFPEMSHFGDAEDGRRECHDHNVAQTSLRDRLQQWTEHGDDQHNQASCNNTDHLQEKSQRS